MGRKGDPKIINEFIRDNLELFLSTENNLALIKAAKYHFFNIKHRKKLGILKNPQLANKVVKVLIETGVIKSETDFNKFVQSSFFLRKYVIVKEFSQHVPQQPVTELLLSDKQLVELKYQLLIKEKTSDLKEEIKKELEEQIRSQVEAEFKIKIETQEEYVQQIEEQVREKEEEFEEMKDVIEKSKSNIEYYQKLELTPKSISELELDEYMEEYGPSIEKTTWWQRLNLRQNPFPTTVGLRKIDPKFHDGIVLKTHLFKKYLSLIKSYPKEVLSKSFIICGEFGCGKTTMFDYLQKPIYNQDILPILVMLSTESDYERIKRDFFKEIFHTLSDQMVIMGSGDPRSYASDIDRIILAGLMTEIIKTSTYTGIIIFIDGLHRGDRFRQESFEFLRDLQNTMEYFIMKGIDVGFFIAGSKRWFNDLKDDPRISGSFYRFDVFSEMSEGEAYEMLHRRFKTFAMDPDNIVKIDRDYISRVYQNTKSRKTKDITFRDFIDEILPKLEVMDFNFLSMKLDNEMIKQIQKELFTNRFVMQAIKKLIGLFTNDKENYTRILRIIASIESEKIIFEKSPKFKNNKEMFGILLNCQLIEKIYQSRAIGWTLQKEFRNAILKINQKYNLLFGDYFLDIFNFYSIKQLERTKLDPEPIQIIDRILISSTEYYEWIHHFLEGAKIGFWKIHNFMETLELKMDITELINLAQESLRNLLKAIFRISEEIDFNSEEFESKLFSLFSRMWLGNDEFKEFYDYLGNYERKHRISDINPHEFGRNFLRAFLKCAQDLDYFIRLNSILYLGSRNLSDKDKKTLNKVRIHFDNREYFDATRNLTDFVELKTRIIVFLLLNIHAGDKWKRLLPTDVKDYLYLKMEETSKKFFLPQKIKPDSINELFYCDRSHYGKIICKKDNWKQIFKKTFGNMKRDDVARFYELFSDLAAKDKHIYKDEFWIENKPKLLQFIISSKAVLISLNRSIYTLLSNSTLFEDEDKKYYFSWTALKDKPHLKPITISIDEGNKIYKRIESYFKEKSSILNPLDLNEVTDTFITEYRKLITILAVAIKKGRAIIKPYIGGKIIVKILTSSVPAEKLHEQEPIPPSTEETQKIPNRVDQPKTKEVVSVHKGNTEIPPKKLEIKKIKPKGSKKGVQQKLLNELEMFFGDKNEPFELNSFLEKSSFSKKSILKLFDSPVVKNRYHLKSKTKKIKVLQAKKGQIRAIERELRMKYKLGVSEKNLQLLALISLMKKKDQYEIQLLCNLLHISYETLESLISELEGFSKRAPIIIKEIEREDLFIIK